MSYHPPEIIFEDARTPQSRRRLEIGFSDIITVGRNQSCPQRVEKRRISDTHTRLNIQHQAVSKDHFQFYSVSFDPEHGHLPLVYVRDLGSSNGVYVEGRGRIGDALSRLSGKTWHLLQHGDSLMIEPFFRFQLLENYQSTAFTLPPDLQHQARLFAKDYTLLNRSIASGDEHGLVSLAVPLADRTELSNRVVVYLANAMGSDNTVVCKVTSVDGPRSNLSVLEQEASVHSHLVHPHVIQFLKAYHTDDYFCIITELACGGDLHSLLAREGVLPEETIRWYVRQVALGIKYIHAHEVVHADLKPDNILVMNSPSPGAHPRLVIADFGAAEPFDTGRFNRMRTRGTSGYLAPEVIAPEKPFGLEVDIWGIGILACHMLTGNAGSTFGGITDPPSLPLDLPGIINQVNLDRNHQGLDTISQEARDFLTACLQLKPSRRPNVSELLEHPWLNGDKSELFKECEEEIKRNWQMRPLPYPVIRRLSTARPASNTHPAPIHTVPEAPAPVRPLPLSDNVQPLSKPLKRSAPVKSNQGKRRRGNGDPKLHG